MEMPLFRSAEQAWLRVRAKPWGSPDGCILRSLLLPSQTETDDSVLAESEGDVQRTREGPAEKPALVINA